MKFKKRENITVQAVEDETLLLDLASNNIHQLNTSASFIWQNCDGNNTEADLEKLLLNQYEIDAATAKQDTKNIINQLLEMRLIEKIE